MKEGDFSIGTRRATRVAIRIPLQITVRTSSGIAETVSAWTLVVNIHGARCESTRQFEVNEQVELVNTLNNQKTIGKVVWCDNRPDGAGKFEFAVELHEPSNLWHINFPPRDWKEVQKSAPETNAIASTATPEEKQETKTAAAEIESNPVAPHTEPLQPAAITQNVQEENVEEDNVREENVQEAIDTAAADTDVTEDLVTALPPEAESTPRAAAESVQAPAAPAPLPHISVCEPKPPQPSPADTQDRLTLAVSELVESALRTTIEAETSRLVETRVAQLADRAQKIMVETLRQIAQAGEERSRSVAQMAEEAATASLNGLRDRVLQQMPAIEDQIIERCKSETNELASVATDKARHVLSDQLDEFSEKAGQREQAILDSITDAERQSVETLGKTAARVEAQMAASSKAALESLSRNLVQNINTTYQTLLIQTEEQIDAASERALRDTRNSLARSLRELADVVSDPRQADVALRDAVSRIFIRPLEEGANGSARRTEERELTHGPEAVPVPADAPFATRRLVKL